MPIPYLGLMRGLSKLGDAKFFTTLDLGSAFWQVPPKEAGQGQDRVCLRVGSVSMETDAGLDFAMPQPRFSG